MATCADVCNQAGRLARVLGEGETYAGQSLTDAFTRLQRLIGAWITPGYLEIPVPSDTSDELGVSPAALNAIELNLAKALASLNGTPLNPLLLEEAKDAKDLLSSQSVRSIKLDMGAGGLGVSRGRYNIVSDS